MQASKFGFNFQLAYGSQSPVTELPPSEKGFYDTMGNAWEWAEDHFSAFAGFKVHPFYEDFSSPCFAGKHQLILGGSFISTGQLASKHARYQFRPHFFQHATFRVVRQEVDRSLYDMARYGRENPIVPFFPTSCMDCAEPHVGDGPCCSVHRRSAYTPTMAEGLEQCKAMQEATETLYESDAVVSQYLAMHFGPADKVYPRAILDQGGLLQASMDSHRMAAQELAAWARRFSLPLHNAIDLGCACGRATFELVAAGFAEAVGLDISATLIGVAGRIKDSGHFDYDLRVEGELTERVAATLEGRLREAGVAQRTRFVRGDACRLPPELLGAGSAGGCHDAVLVANVLDRVPEPRLLLGQVALALRPGGVALITSPFSWSDKYTGRSNWIGATYKDGEAQRSSDALHALLAGFGFEVLEEGSVPLLLPEHSRKFELLIAHKLVLRKI